MPMQSTAVTGDTQGIARRGIMQVPMLPDPKPEELWKHVAKCHKATLDLQWQGIVAYAHYHLLAHVRGDFTGSLHFHVGEEDASGNHD